MAPTASDAGTPAKSPSSRKRAKRPPRRGLFMTFREEKEIYRARCLPHGLYHLKTSPREGYRDPGRSSARAGSRIGERRTSCIELSLRICGAAQTHLQSFLCEERGNSFADSDPYCGWRSTLMIEVMQLD